MRSKWIIGILVLVLLLSSVGTASAYIWYPSDHYEDSVGAYDYDINKDSGPAEATNFDHDNYLGLSVEADNVKGPEEYGQSDEETNIELFATLTGHSEWYDEWQLTKRVGPGGTIITDQAWFHTEPTQLKLEATISNCDESANPSIDWKKSRNKGANVGGEDQPDSYDGFNTPMENTLETSTKIIADETPAGIVMSTENFIDAVREDMSNTKYINEIDGDSGDDAHIVQKWDINKNQDDLVYEKRVKDKDDHTKDVGTMNFSASTGLDWDIPATYQNHCTINLKASLLMEHNQDGEITQEWGAETDTVTFTIKNGEINPSIESTNEDSGTGSENNRYEYYTSDFDYTDHIYPEFKIEANSPDNPDVHLYIEWKHGGEDYATTDKWLKADDFPIYLDHSYFVGDDEDVYDTEWDIEFSLSVPDYQGGWEYHETVYIDGINDEDDGGGGGGGGCPYASPWTGDDYERENNLLMDTEFEEGEVTDQYLLENSLQPKDGSYNMKIEEFENSNDFFNQVQLYTLDHTKNTELGLTPDEELTSYSKSDLNAPNSATLNEVSILEKLKVKDDKNRAAVEEDDTVYLDFGDITNYRWSQSKLVVTASGFESSTESDFSTNAEIKSLRSLYFSIRTGDDEWTKVDVIHPRNNPSDYVIPFKEAIQESGFDDGEQDSSLQVRINSTASHSIDRVALDDSHPTPVKKKKADLQSAIMKHSKVKTDVTDMLKKDDHKYANIVPGEEIKLTFSIPEESFGEIYNERDFLLVTKGDYCIYEG